MKKKIIIFMSLLFLTFCVLATEESSEKPLLAVMEIEDKTEQFYEVVGGATEYLRSALIRSNKFFVIAESRQRAKMQELKEASRQGCYDEGCKIKLGKELAADTILVTTINSLGSHYEIASTLIDLEKGVHIKSALVTFEEKESLHSALKDIADQISDRRLGNLEESNFYGTYDSLSLDDRFSILFGTFFPGASLMVTGFATLAVGLWHEFKVKEDDNDFHTSGCGYLCWEYDYVSHNQNDYSYIDSHTSREQAQAKADKSRQAHIISGAVLLGAGIPFFITGLTYAVWDKYTKGERAAGFMISFGTLAAAGGGAMIGFNDGDNTMFYGGIAAAAVGGGLLIGGITMAILDAKARKLKGTQPKTSFFVSPTKGGAYAQLGVNF